MKKSKIILVAVTVVAMATSTFAKLGVQSRKHLTFSVGIVLNELPVAVADMKLPMAQVAYDYSFMDPSQLIRTSFEFGVYGFYGLLPVPEVGANLYIGRESQDIQGKLGINGFYDISVGGHAGMAIKPGILIKNRVDFSFIVVPFGTDSKQSYKEFFQLESKQDAEESYIKNGNRYVVVPYFGVMLGLRF